MLNLTEIAARIKQPELCVASDIDSLKTLCETYPYSQIFPLLYLKTLAQTNDVRLEGELQKFAYRISNRAVLYDLLHASEQAKAEVTKSIENEPQITEVVESQPVPVNQEQTLTNNVQEIEPIVELEQVVEPTEVLEEVHAIEPVVVIELTEEKDEEIPQELPSIEDDLLLSLNIPTEVYSIEAEELKNREVVEVQQENTSATDLEAEKQKLIAALAASKPLVSSSTSQEKNEEQPEKQPVEETVGPRSFTSWLKSSTPTTSDNKVEVATKVDSNQLIDQFILKEPKISPAKEKLFEDRVEKKELYNPTKKAKESLDDTQLPVSETLAKIFAAQGNYPKAISAYQQLMLIFPEKKVFFASQIEDLNKKLNT